METYEQKFTVELGDVAPNFGIKSTAILKYYQETFARYCAKYHVAGYDTYKMGLKWVLGQTVLKFFDIMPIWNEEVISKVYISNIKKLRMYIDFEISTKRGLVATGQSIAYILNMENSRPQPIDRISGNFVLDEDNLSGETIKFECANYGENIAEKKHTITFSDIDYNNHTNNISYIALAFEGMPANYIEEKYPSKISIKYLQETFLGDTLVCKIAQGGNCFSYNIINAKNNSDVCIINAVWDKENMNQEGFFEVLKEVR